MANTTKNYGLIKPLENEYYDVEIQNSNMDAIDRKLKENEDTIGEFKRELKVKIPASLWVENGEFFVAELSVKTIKESDNPILFSVVDEILRAKDVKEYNKNFAYIHKGSTLNGVVKLYAYKKPRIDLNIGLRGR